MSERESNHKPEPPEDHKPEPPEDPKPIGFFGRRKRNPAEYSAWALASSMGLSLVLATVMGLLFGYWLDRKLGTNPIFLLIFLFMGIGAGFKNLFVIHKRIERYQASGAAQEKKPQNGKEQSSGQEKQ